MSQAVEDALRATDTTATGGGKLTVTRIAGADRYATARMIGTAAGTSLGAQIDGKKTAIVARGELFPDALAGGAPAYAGKLPVLITPGGSSTSTLGPDAKSALVSLGIEQVLILGGSSAISAGTEAAIRDARGTGSITTVRLEGSDRTETARAIAEYALTKLGFSKALVDLARGDDFADALAGGAYAGVNKSPILLTQSPTVLSASAAVGAKRYLRDHSDTLTGGAIFGGTSAVSEAVETEAEAAAGSDASPPSMASATANATANTVVVRYTEPVTCIDSDATRAQFSYKATIAATPASVMCDGSANVLLSFSDISSASDLAYTDDSATPDAGDITDLAGNQATSPQTITTVNASDTTAPQMTAAAANLVSETVSVTYTEPVQCSDTAATAKQFTYLGASPTTPTSITCNGTVSVLLRFTDVTAGNTLTYNDDSSATDSNDIRDPSGNPAMSPQAQSATVSSDMTVPSMASAVWNKVSETVSITYNEPVSCADLQGTRNEFGYTGATPAAPNPTTQDAATPSSVQCSGTTSVVLFFDDVTGVGNLTYTDESPSSDANDVRDLAGNSATSPQTIVPVASNDTNGPPKMSSATADATTTKTVTITYDQNVKCTDSPATGAQFSYTGASPSTPTSVTCKDTPAVVLTFVNVSGGGSLTYTDEDAKADTNDILDDSGNPATSPQTLTGITATTAPSMTTATADSTANNVTVTYNKPVTCPGTASTQFSYTGAVPAPATSVTCNGTTSVVVTFGRITSSGNLSYTDDNPAADANDVKDLVMPVGNSAISPQTIGATLAAFRMASATRGTGLAANQVMVTYTEAIVCPAKPTSPPTPPSDAFRSQFTFTGGNPTKPNDYSCSGAVLTLTFDIPTTPGTLTYTASSTDASVHVKNTSGKEADDHQAIPVA